VAQEQSLSRAARSLHISQPAVTQHIKLLEQTFKTALFLRSSSGVTLTAQGVLLLEHAQRVAEMDEAITQKLTAQSGTLSGRLRLGASTTITQYYLPDVLVALKTRHPAVEIEVIEGNSDAVISSLLAQRIELGLIEAPCRRRDLRVQSFYEDEIIVIAPADHPLVQRPFVRLEELVRQPMIVREVGSGTRMSVETELRRRKVPLANLFILQELPSTEAIKRMVEKGAGVGFVSRISVTGEIKAGRLVQLRVRGLHIRRDFSAILPLGPDPVGLRQLMLGYLLQT
jgi:DNA-binding transcriptional LysR family regulator